jgi:hypothetical protein
MMSRKEIELRDWYAGLAMQALFDVHKGTGIGELIAKDAFEMADIMMEQRREALINE